MTSNTIYNVSSIQSKIMSDFKSDLENLFDETVSQLESKFEESKQSYCNYDSKLKYLFSKHEDCINYDNPETSFILTTIRKILLLERKVFSDYEIFYEDGDVSQLFSNLNFRYDNDLFTQIKIYIQDMDVDAFIEDYFLESIDFSEMEKYILKNEDKLYRIEKILKRKLFEKERKESIILKKKQIEDLKLKIEELEKELISIRENLL